MRYIANIDNAIECYHVGIDGRILSIAVTLQSGLPPKDYAKLLRRAAQWFDDVADGNVASAKCSPDCKQIHHHIYEVKPVLNL